MEKIYVIFGSTGTLMNQDYERWAVCAFRNFDKAKKYVKLLDNRAAEIIANVGGKYLPYDPAKHGNLN